MNAIPRRETAAGKNFVAIMREISLRQKGLAAIERMREQRPVERDTRFDTVFESFAELSVISRPSGNEREASEFVARRGERYLQQGLIRKMDVEKESRNVTWDIPATPGYDTQEGSTILQGHLDAVCKSSNPLKNPAINGMKLEVVEKDGSYIIQSEHQETTAGVDNGLMAMFLLELPQLLNDLQIPHGRLKVIFTTGEEAGLDGAKAYQGDLSEYSNLINIDSEEERFITAGSAAIGFTEIALNVQRTSSPPLGKDIVYKTFSVSGLHGGHSGATIADTAGEHPTRQNAIHLASDLISRFAPSAQIASIGADSDLRNAISSEASFVLALSKKEAQQLQDEAIRMNAQILADGEKDTASITLVEVDRPESVLTYDSSKNVIRLLSELPYGVPSGDSKYAPKSNGPQVIQNRMKKSADGSFYEESETVALQTATNLARTILGPADTTLSVGMMTRSSGENPVADLKGLQEEIGDVARKYDAVADHTEPNPAWSATPNSELSRIAQDAYAATFPGRQPLTEVVTLGGLEIAYFLKNFEHLIGHTISIGPDIFGAHSVTEHSPYDSGERACLFTLEIIRTLAQNGKAKAEARRSTLE